jgi:hypothetical protein
MREMRPQLLATLEAPMAHTVGALQALLTGLLYAMDAKCKKESA